MQILPPTLDQKAHSKAFMPDQRIISTTEAICEAMAAALKQHPNSYLMGEGVNDPGRIFGTTNGLIETYGPERVIEMPVAENGLTGIAIGSALLGQRPIMVHQRVDFALLCLEQLFNTAAKCHYVSGGAHRVPLTVRMVIGRGWGQGPAHSQSLETLFAYIPGLKVVMPTTPEQFKGLLLGAIEDENPVIVLEHRWLHYSLGHVPEDYFSIPIDGPRVARKGNDITIVATSYMLLEALRAAEALADQGLSAEVIDLRVLRPLKMGPIFDSLRKTGRLIACDTGWKTLGTSAEILARVSEDMHGALACPPCRIGLPDHPTPSSIELAAKFYPDSSYIIDAVQSMCGLGNSSAEAARKAVRHARGDVPIDQPDPSFKGPF